MRKKHSFGIISIVSKTILYFQGTKCEANRLKLAGLTRFANARGWSISILQKPDKRDSIRKILGFWKPDGVIANLDCDPRDFGNTPVIIMSTPPKHLRGKAFFIVHDSDATTAVVAKELLRLGYGHYAFVGAIDGQEWSPAREAAFKKILKLHGLACTSFTPGPNDRRDSIALLSKLRSFLANLPKPCALFAANDIIGRSVLAAAQTEGIRVPDELAVCAVDNDEEICLHTTPTLSSVEPDFERGGMLAGLLFQEIFDHPGLKPRQDHFGPLDLHRRGSTSSTPHEDRLVNKAVEYIRREVQGGVTVTQVVAQFPCSKRMVEIRFKKATGRTVQEEILSARLELAYALLRRPSLSLDAIANLSGWKSYGVFRRHFTQVTGLSPRAWRKRECR